MRRKFLVVAWRTRAQLFERLCIHSRIKRIDRCRQLRPGPIRKVALIKKLLAVIADGQFPGRWDSQWDCRAEHESGYRSSKQRMWPCSTARTTLVQTFKGEEHLLVCRCPCRFAMIKRSGDEADHKLGSAAMKHVCRSQLYSTRGELSSFSRAQSCGELM